MRKILNQEDREKKEQRNKLLVGIVLIIVMLFSTLGYAFYSSRASDSSAGREIVYNDIEFKQTNYGTWQFEYGKEGYETKFNPKEVENISVNTAETLSNYFGNTLYFGIYSIEDVFQAGYNEILVNLGKIIPRYNMACMDETCTEDYPIKDCTQDNVIIFKNSEDTRIIEENGCVVIYTNSSNQEKAADAFLFKIMGIR